MPPRQPRTRFSAGGKFTRPKLRNLEAGPSTNPSGILVPQFSESEPGRYRDLLLTWDDWEKGELPDNPIVAWYLNGQWFMSSPGNPDLVADVLPHTVYTEAAGIDKHTDGRERYLQVLPSGIARNFAEGDYRATQHATEDLALERQWHANFATGNAAADLAAISENYRELASRLTKRKYHAAKILQNVVDTSNFLTEQRAPALRAELEEAPMYAKSETSPAFQELQHILNVDEPDLQKTAQSIEERVMEMDRILDMLDSDDIHSRREGARLASFAIKQWDKEEMNTYARRKQSLAGDLGLLSHPVHKRLRATHDQRLYVQRAKEIPDKYPRMRAPSPPYSIDIAKATNPLLGMPHEVSPLVSVRREPYFPPQTMPIPLEIDTDDESDDDAAPPRDDDQWLILQAREQAHRDAQLRAAQMAEALEAVEKKAKAEARAEAEAEAQLRQNEQQRQHETDIQMERQRALEAQHESENVRRRHEAEAEVRKREVAAAQAAKEQADAEAARQRNEVLEIHRMAQRAADEARRAAMQAREAEERRREAIEEQWRKEHQHEQDLIKVREEEKRLATERITLERQRAQEEADRKHAEEIQRTQQIAAQREQELIRQGREVIEHTNANAMIQAENARAAAAELDRIIALANSHVAAEEAKHQQQLREMEENLRRQQQALEGRYRQEPDITWTQPANWSHAPIAPYEDKPLSAAPARRGDSPIPLDQTLQRLRGQFPDGVCMTVPVREMPGFNEAVDGDRVQLILLTWDGLERREEGAARPVWKVGNAWFFGPEFFPSEGYPTPAERRVAVARTTALPAGYGQYLGSSLQSIIPWQQYPKKVLGFDDREADRWTAEISAAVVRDGRLLSQYRNGEYVGPPAPELEEYANTKTR